VIEVLASTLLILRDLIIVRLATSLYTGCEEVYVFHDLCNVLATAFPVLLSTVGAGLSLTGLWNGKIQQDNTFYGDGGDDDENW
jgi:hypothetical protein